jgi:hypothetical protein
MNSDNSKLIIAQRWSLEVSFNDKAINHLTGEQKDSTYEKMMEPGRSSECPNLSTVSNQRDLK